MTIEEQTNMLDELADLVVDDLKQWNKFYKRVAEINNEIESLSLEGVEKILSARLLKRFFINRKYNKKYEAKRLEYNHYVEICNWIHDDYFENLKKMLPLMELLHQDDIQLINDVKKEINKSEVVA